MFYRGILHHVSQASDEEEGSDGERVEVDESVRRTWTLEGRTRDIEASK